jgi:phosphotransferase system IIA component
VFFALSDLNSDGVYDAIDFSISEDDTTLPDLSAFGEGNLGDGSVVDGNDERITAAGATHVSGVYTGNATFKIGTEFSVELA